MDNANHLYDGLQKLGYELSSHISPVVPVIIGSKEEGFTHLARAYFAGRLCESYPATCSACRHYAAAL